MSKFKEFFYLSEKALPAPAKAPGVGGTSKVTGRGLQTGGGWDFPQMGFGYQPIQGPGSLSQYLQLYDRPHETVEWRLLQKAATVAQSIAAALNSQDPDEISLMRTDYGKDIDIQGQVGSGGTIRNIALSHHGGKGLMHRGIARGYQFSAAEIDWLIKEGILTYANKDTKTGDVTVDLHGDVLAAAIQNRVKGQNLKIGAAQGYDWITRLMSQPGQVGAHHSVRGAS